MIAWGIFDSAFVGLLTAMLRHAGTEAGYKGWEHFSFDRRLALFNDELSACFSHAPDLMARLTALSADSEPLQIKRNVLVHGQIALQIGPHEEPRLTAVGRHRGRQIIETFSTDQIDDLYYEIIHLAGRMVGFIWPDRVAWEPPLPSQDKSALLDVLSKNPNLPSTVSTVSGLRRPSPP